MSNKDKYPHFRYYIKSKHPVLIIGENSEGEYLFRKVTSSERDGGRPNEKIEPNPDPTRTTPMYIGKRIRHDKKKFFDKRILPWTLPNKYK